MSTGWVALGVAVVGGVASAVQSSKANKSAEKMRNQQMSQMDQTMARVQEFRDTIPAQSREMIERLNASHAEINALLAEAKKNGDKQAAAFYGSMRALVISQRQAELEAIGVNSAEITGLIDELSDNAIRLANEDSDANDVLKEIYKKETESAMENLSKMAGISGRRLDTLMKEGVTPEGLAIISKTRQGIADMERETKNLAAQVGKGGSDSQANAVRIEGMKALGEITANLQAGNDAAIQAAGIVQAQVLAGQGERQDRLQETRGRMELAARQPFDSARTQRCYLFIVTSVNSYVD